MLKYESNQDLNEFFHLFYLFVFCERQINTIYVVYRSFLVAHIAYLLSTHFKRTKQNKTQPNEKKAQSNREKKRGTMTLSIVQRNAFGPGLCIST